MGGGQPLPEIRLELTILLRRVCVSVFCLYPTCTFCALCKVCIGSGFLCVFHTPPVLSVHCAKLDTQPTCIFCVLFVSHLYFLCLVLS